MSYQPEDGNRQVLVIAGALRENKGLFESDLRYGPWVIDETWATIYDSLETHPTLQVLNLWSAQYRAAPLAPAVLESRI
jgi:hypothetical protein